MGYKTLADNLFNVHEISKDIPIEQLDELLNGQRAVIIVKQFITEEICKKITDNFSHYQKSRVNNDEVPGDYIGAYHYNKYLDDYFNEVEIAEEQIDALFANTENAVYALQDHLERRFQGQGKKCRIAQFNGRPAGRVVARKWTDSGKYSLKPHDDIAQLTFKPQQKFEIQQVKQNTIVGVNICVCNSHVNGGNLVIWNCITDDDERERLDIAETGYPYPLDFLTDFKTLEISIQPGDLYFLNSTLVHAVSNQKFNERLTLSFFLGRIDQQTAIYWT